MGKRKTKREEIRKRKGTWSDKDHDPVSAEAIHKHLSVPILGIVLTVPGRGLGGGWPSVLKGLVGDWRGLATIGECGSHLRDYDS